MQANLENGIKLFEQKDYDGAIKELSEAIKRDSKLAEAYAYRARAYNSKSDYDRGLSDANMAIQLNPTLAIAYYARAYVYLNKEDYNSAISDYTQAIRLDPKYTYAYFNRGLAYQNKGDYNSAIADYTQVIKLDPKYTDAYFNRGVVYLLGKKDYDRAIADYTEVIKLDPKNVGAYGNRGAAYAIKEDYNSAIADYTEALKLNPNFTQAKNALAEANRLAEAQKANRNEPLNVQSYQTQNTQSSVISITASDLYSAYDANRLRADQQYKDKTLKVTGKVTDIGQDAWDNNYIILDSHVYFRLKPSETNKAIALNKSQTVTLTGICEGETGFIKIIDAVFSN
jgi:tetratricopeptide (TPR) repeat protein